MPELEAWWRQQAGGGKRQDKRRAKEAEGAREPAGLLLTCWSGLLVAAACYAWWPCVRYNMEQGGFFMDDQMIRKNANVYEELDWRRVFRTDYWGLEMFEEGQWTHKSFRPLTVLSFRLNYWYHTFNSSGWHITNLALHGVCSLLLGLFGATALSLPLDWSLLLVALFFAHPVHTESVLYIVGRADLMCCAFIVLAVLIYAPCIVGRSRGVVCATLRLLLSAVLLVAAGLCKETGFCFFGLIAGWEILRGLLPRVGRGGRQWTRWIRLAFLLALGTAACYVRVWYTGTAIERMDPHSNPFAVLEDRQARMLSYALVHGLYAKLLVLPTFLCYDYSLDAVPFVQNLEDLRLMLPAAAYLFFAQLLCCSLRALRPCRQGFGKIREGPIIGAATIILSFMPMANVLFPVGTVIGERLLYIPSAGFLIAIVSLAHASGSRRWALPLLLAGVGSVWLCAKRVPEWENSDTITVADGQKQLRSARVQFNYANIHLQEKRYDEALLTYKRAIDIDPTDRDSLPLYHSGQILFYQGRHQEAEAYLYKAVSGYFSPLTIKEEEIWHDYGLILWFVQKPQDSILNFQKALAINPTFTKALNNMACAAGYGAWNGLLQREYMQYALNTLEQALMLEPTNILYWRNSVALLTLAGDHQTAMAAWQRASALDPQGGVTGPPQECSWEFYFR